jgi:hypothetical protein
MLLPLIIIGGGFACAGAVLYGTWLLGWYRGREARDSNVLPTVDARLDRLEQTVDQLMNAFDRLEAMQSVHASLAARATPPERLRPPSITPH